ncbi:hypothetical protein ml_372 [Mollivirus sibericum]|uniref:hypothetical protein n=1 Tax=Mollivirus sibericum TaxID=1678078 RepID=UPI0006B2E17B|nr:hypothetical protein ml_372 [Mollivirus sibericum]ALD62174.1 hypothetical protein ml_372 [Mollivirus sibericum]
MFSLILTVWLLEGVRVGRSIPRRFWWLLYLGTRMGKQVLEEGLSLFDKRQRQVE